MCWRLYLFYCVYINNKINTSTIKIFLDNYIPGVYVDSLQIGNSSIEDLENGYFLNPNKQVEFVCKYLTEKSELKEGFNAIGFSQGSQILYGFLIASRSPALRPHPAPDQELDISWRAAPRSLWSVPLRGPAAPHLYYIRQLLNYAAYQNWVLHVLVQATYWHDPLDQENYVHKTIFLPDINNEVFVNKTYIQNLQNLEHLVLVKFANDTIVQPRETEWFGLYEPGQSKKLLPMRETRDYKADRLGHKNMEKEGKLILISTEDNHLCFSDKWFIETIIKPYLLN